jgi:hypothetical protein
MHTAQLDSDAPPPSVRLEFVYDDGEIAGERVLLQDEFEEASQRFPSINSQLEQIDPPVDPAWAGNLTAVVVCEDGSQATATWSGEAWRWVNWSPPGVPHLA